jgi:hypothetical protein
MILYTIVPEHLIFPPADDEYGKQKIVYHDGIPFLARETETKEWEIVRNLSTNPLHFLNEKYAPGERIPPVLETS